MPEDATLRLEPFCGVRYRDGIDLARVTTPPYDVLDAAAVRRLTEAEPHNLVRLVLPQGPDPRARNAAARATLDSWLADGTLVADDRPALYVYEIAAGSRVRLRGLIAAVALDPGAVLPHEDVMAPVVTDRTELQEALEAQVEPIWLIHHGGGPAATAVDETTLTTPAAQCVTSDGLTHRLWAVTDQAAITTVVRDLTAQRAVIADGHHRWTAYRTVQAHHQAAGDGPGPWDYGLALLVDTAAHPPEVSAIHRVVSGLDVERVHGDWEHRPVADWRTALAGLRPGALLLVGASGQASLLTLPTGPARSALFAGTPGAEMPAAWQDLDTAVLHTVLLPRLTVAEEAVTYHHDAEAAVAAAAAGAAVAVLLAPIDVGDALALASAGIRLPRKSTSFGPKPRGGFVLRAFGR